MLKQRLALVGDADYIGDHAVTEARDGALLDQSLPLKRLQAGARARLVAARALEIVREHRAEARRSLQQIHFRSAKVVEPCCISQGLTIGTRREREVMFARAEIRVAVSGELVGELADCDRVVRAVSATRFKRRRLR